jgi:hypothetical protein
MVAKEALLDPSVNDLTRAQCDARPAQHNLRDTKKGLSFTFDVFVGVILHGNRLFLVTMH